MIGEDMYIEEIVKFVQGMNNPALYPNTLEKDIEVLSLLEKIEISDGGFER